jgi:uncharacterized membrane-anchored protein
MSKMVNMKIDRSTAKAYAEPAMVDAPAYPWGLNLTLDNETLEKLKLETLPEAGEQLLLVAKVKVTNTSSSDSADGKKHQTVSLQITDMCLEDGGEKVEASEKLYQG